MGLFLLFPPFDRNINDILGNTRLNLGVWVTGFVLATAGGWIGAPGQV